MKAATSASQRPWHMVVQLRDDVRKGELSLATFAADLYDVTMNRGRSLYRDPKEFFALTYPTYNLRELAKDVVLRLAGKNDKTVRQLELTYGGGKTHTLITLLHLVRDPDSLPELPSVHEFRTHIGQTPPKTRVAVLAFDKLDVEKGMEVQPPSGKTRWLRHPWSVLAYQLGGKKGLELLHPDGKAEERETAPAENLLSDLLALPQEDDLATLVLLDEVLMYVRGKVLAMPEWRSRLVDFFQFLTQAATKVKGCAVVASILRSEIKDNDDDKTRQLTKQLEHEVEVRFGRQGEARVEPVAGDDVAEILRRRLFTPESLRDMEARTAPALGALKAISEIDDATKKSAKVEEASFIKTYPFHPDLSDVLYSKWTNLEAFQRTRGVLRTFALALRDAEKWDKSPVIGPQVFLGREKVAASGSVAPPPGLSEAARELATIARSEEYEGKRQEWRAILEGELTKAREIQEDLPGLKHRELEQAVMATFLHSQPIGMRASTREIMRLVGSTKPDKIELEKGLGRWTDVSWFLDEELIQKAEVAGGGKRGLPKEWRLGSRPNLQQMHDDAYRKMAPEVVEAKLVSDLATVKSLTAGAATFGAKVHAFPKKPSDVGDDGEFRFVVLGPKAVSESGKPSTEAKRYLDETTGPDRPRAYRNAVVIAAPLREGLESARDQVRAYLAWEDVKLKLAETELDSTRRARLNERLEEAKRRVPDAIRQAWCIVATVSETNEAQAFKLTVGSDGLFQTIKADKRARIQEEAIAPDALLPGGPYDSLWQQGETARRAKDLVDAFGQVPRFPKMLNRKAIFDTIARGCLDGLFVLRVTGKDKVTRTIWKSAAADSDLADSSLEVVLPEGAVLTSVASELLVPGALPSLWKGPRLPFGDLVAVFAGGGMLTIKKEGYEEALPVPKAERGVLEEAVRVAVRAGKLWLCSSGASLLEEDVPPGLITDAATLEPPPSPIPPTELLAESLPEVWTNTVATANALANGISKKRGHTLPWKAVRDSIDGALKARLLVLDVASKPWPCDAAGSPFVLLAAPSTPPRPDTPPPFPRPGKGITAEAELTTREIQELAEQVSKIVKLAADWKPTFTVRIQIGSSGKAPPAELVEKLNTILNDVSTKLRFS